MSRPSGEDRKARYVRLAIDNIYFRSGTIRSEVQAELMRKLGSASGMFLYQLARVEGALDVYEDALDRWMPDPPVIVAAVAVAESSNPLGLAVAFLAAALASSSESSDRPAAVEAAEEGLDIELLHLRNLLPASMAVDWAPYGTPGVRVGVEKLKVALEKAAESATVAGAALRLPGNPISAVRTLTQTNINVMAATGSRLKDFVEAVDTATASVETLIGEKGPNSGCDDLIAAFRKAVKELAAILAANAKQKQGAVKIIRAYTAYKAAVNAVLKCLGNVPMFPD
jgi:hypothetical protein